MCRTRTGWRHTWTKSKEIPALVRGKRSHSTVECSTERGAAVRRLNARTSARVTECTMSWTIQALARSSSSPLTTSPNRETTQCLIPILQIRRAAIARSATEPVGHQIAHQTPPRGPTEAGRSTLPMKCPPQTTLQDSTVLALRQTSQAIAQTGPRTSLSHQGTVRRTRPGSTTRFHLIVHQTHPMPPTALDLGTRATAGSFIRWTSSSMT